VQRHQAGAEEQCTEVRRELSLVEDALAKCDREEQRWAQAYVGEVINLAELKGYGAEIAAHRESILTQRQQLQTKLDTIGLAVEHVEALIGYCARVRQKVQTFGAAEQRLAFEALNVRVTWTPGEPLAIEGTIPFDEIVPLPLECVLPRPAGRECVLMARVTPLVAVNHTDRVLALLQKVPSVSWDIRTQCMHMGCGDTHDFPCPRYSR